MLSLDKGWDISLWEVCFGDTWMDSDYAIKMNSRIWLTLLTPDFELFFFCHDQYLFLAFDSHD